MGIIELRNVTRVVNRETHIFPTDLKLQSGEFNILLGATKSGKTSLMRLMAGLDRPLTGEVWFDGENVTGVPVKKRNVAMVYQQFINYPGFTVFENLASPLRVKKIPAAEIKERVLEIARMLRLEEFLDRKPAELSGGQQQRTALARALIKNASLVLLDEPLANLDYKLREELRDELPKLFIKTGATIVYATTDPTEALLMGGYTAVLHQGRVMQYGKTYEVFKSPANLESAEAFSDPPINLHLVIKSNNQIRLDSISWEVPKQLLGYPDGEYLMGIRPHHLSLSRGKPPGKDQVSLSGKVKIAEITGSETLIHFSQGEQLWVAHIHSVEPMGLGQEISLLMDIRYCLYFDQEHKII